MAIPAKPTLTAPPTAPVRGEDRATFATKANAYVVFIGTNVTDLTAAIDWQNTVFTATEAEATDAAQSAVDAAAEVVLAGDQVALAIAQVALAADEVDLAEAAAAAAVATANASAWVSEASYSANDNAISGIDFGTYRAILTHTGVATDPSADPTNWVKISAPAKASQAEAEAGTENTKFLTSLRTAQAIAALSPGLTTDATTGASQSIDFSSNKIVTSTANAATVTYTFASPAAVAKVDLIIDYQSVTSYDLSSASYDSIDFSVVSQDSYPSGLAFNSDGTKMFVVGLATGKVFQYSLSTGFDLSTASYYSVDFSVRSQDGSPEDVAFNLDGTKMFIVGNSGNRLFQYSLSTGFDLSTASYDSVSLHITIQADSPTGIAFNSDGTKMFVCDSFTNKVYQYSLSTGFDLSTASYDSVDFSVISQDNSPEGLSFNSDGTKMFIVGSQNDKVFQYSLSTGFDLSTASYDSVDFSVASQDGVPESVVFGDYGTKMFILGSGNDKVSQYATGEVPALVFPTIDGPSIPLIAGQKTAVTIVTTDGGTSYQVTSTLGGII